MELADGFSAADIVFVALCAALVNLMTPALALFYGGLVHESTMVNTMMMSIISVGVGSILWLMIGFTLAFNGNFRNIAFRGLTDEVWTGTRIPGVLFALFQMTFANIAPAIMSGALVGRIRFGAFVLLIGLWLLGVYVPLCNWIWGGGWIAQMGAKDWAGGTVVHISSGTSAFVVAAMLGKRKHLQEARPNNVPFVILGGSLLWFCWTGFNGGSAYAANLLAVLAITTSYLAAAGGMLAWTCVEWLSRRQPSSIGAISGAVAGLVTITPCAAFVTPLGSLAIGVLGSMACVSGKKLLEKLSWVDDSLDAFSLHGIGGFVGAILLGFFDTKEGVFYGAGFRLLLVQLAGASAGMAYAAIVTACIFMAMQKVMRVRAHEEQEAEGLDLHVHSEMAYSSRLKPLAHGTCSRKDEAEPNPRAAQSDVEASMTDLPTSLPTLLSRSGSERQECHNKAVLAPCQLTGIGAHDIPHDPEFNAREEV